MKLAHHFFSNPAHRVTDRQTDRQNDHITFTLLVLLTSTCLKDCLSRRESACHYNEHVMVVDRDGVLEDCPRARGQLEDPKSWPWPLTVLALALASKWPWPWPRYIGLQSPVCN